MMNIYVAQKYPQAFRMEPGPLQPMVTEIVWLDYAEMPAGHQDVRHLHHFHQLDVILDGEFTLTLEEQDDQAGRPGDAWLIPPLVRHGVNCAHPFRYCSFKFHLAPRFWPLLGTTFQRFRLPSHFCAGIDAMGKRSTSMAPLAGQHAAAMISSCLIELIDQLPQTHDEDDSLDEFRHFLWPLLERIQNEPSIRWNVASLASELSLSPDYFTRCFHRIIGQTPQRYILETAMRGSAADLMKVPTLPVKEIAERAGYANVQAFTHAFTRVFGISPAAYRRQSTPEPHGTFQKISA